jgi:hypothetical protein
VIPERNVSFRWTTSGKDGRIARFEKSLHLYLLVWTRINVAMRIDKARHGGHAFCIYGCAGRCGRRALCH